MPDPVELLARAIHEAYRSNGPDAEGAADDAARQPWSHLVDSLRDSNLDHARHIATHLHSVGLALAPGGGEPATLTEEEIEQLSQLEHARWVRHRVSAGWTPGARDPAARTTPYLVPWDELSEEVRDLDRLFVRQLPDLLATVGLQIVRPPGWVAVSPAADGPATDGGSAPPSAVQLAWERHLAWSRAADRLKRARERLGALVLGLGLLGAVLAAVVIGTGTDTTEGRMLAFGSAASVGVAGVLRSRSGTSAVRDWTRARSVSERIKSEVYRHLALHGDEEALRRLVGELEDDVRDLLPLTQDGTVAAQPPRVHDVDSYLKERVLEQAKEYYRPRALQLEHRARTVQLVTLSLGVCGALLAAAAGTWEAAAVAAWVPVTTTVAAAVTGWAAAARYDFLIVEYTRTAAELERLARCQRTSDALEPADLVAAAEGVLSAQHSGWTARITSTDASS